MRVREEGKEKKRKGRNEEEERERFQKDWVGGKREEGEDSGRKRRRAGEEVEVICEGETEDSMLAAPCMARRMREPQRAHAPWPSL